MAYSLKGLIKKLFTGIRGTVGFVFSVIFGMCWVTLPFLQNIYFPIFLFLFCLFVSLASLIYELNQESIEKNKGVYIDIGYKFDSRDRQINIINAEGDAIITDISVVRNLSKKNFDRVFHQISVPNGSTFPHDLLTMQKNRDLTLQYIDGPRGVELEIQPVVDMKHEKQFYIVFKGGLSENDPPLKFQITLRINGLYAKDKSELNGGSQEFSKFTAVHIVDKIIHKITFSKDYALSGRPMIKCFDECGKEIVTELSKPLALDATNSVYAEYNIDLLKSCGIFWNVGTYKKASNDK